MDTRGYENPFASSEEEIGQMDVAVEEEELLRETVRRLILESDPISPMGTLPIEKFRKRGSIPQVVARIKDTFESGWLIPTVGLVGLLSFIHPTLGVAWAAFNGLGAIGDICSDTNWGSEAHHKAVIIKNLERAFPRSIIKVFSNVVFPDSNLKNLERNLRFGRSPRHDDPPIKVWYEFLCELDRLMNSRDLDNIDPIEFDRLLQDPQFGSWIHNLNYTPEEMIEVWKNWRKNNVYKLTDLCEALETWL